MINESLYTDRIINELTRQVYNNKEAVKFITGKYTEKRFTEYDIRKERRYVRIKIQNSCCSFFDIISGITLSIMGGLVIYLLCNNVFSRGSFFRIFIPLVFTSVLLAVFIYIVMDSREKVKLYNICIDALDKIERLIEKENNKSEVSEMITKSIETFIVQENDDSNEFDTFESEELIC